MTRVVYNNVCAGQSLERNSEDISILMGRGVEMARSESVQDSINTLQGYIDHYGQYRYERELPHYMKLSFLNPPHTEAPHITKIFLFLSLFFFFFFSLSLFGLLLPFFWLLLYIASTSLVVFFPVSNRFYVDIGMASLVLLITLCFAFGLLCGCCGKRPADRYDDDFGTRATGASCLMA